MQVTTEQLARVTPALTLHGPGLLQAADRYGINTPLRLSHWLAQMAHESGGFEVMVENLNYKADALMRLFGRHRISAVDARTFGRTAEHPANQNALANILYGGEWGEKNLGNNRPGDGWRYRGRGYKQITGRTNYHDGSKRIFDDVRLLDIPDEAAQPETAAMLAGDFWTTRKLNVLADRDDIVGVTQKINGGQNGIDLRKQWLARFKAVLL